MPTLPAVPNVAKVRVQGTINGFPWNNLWFFAFTTGAGPATAGDMNALAQNVYGPYTADLRPLWDTETTLEEVDTEDLSSSSSATGAYVAHGAGVATARVDAAASVLCKQIITRRYRGGHPRKYLPPLNGSLITDDDEWDHATITSAATSFGADLQRVWTTPTVPYPTIHVTSMVNVSYYQGFTNIVKPSGRATSRATPRATPLVDVVAGIELEFRIATQRRRLGR